MAPEDLWALIGQSPENFPTLLTIKRSDVSERILVITKGSLADLPVIEASNLFRVSWWHDGRTFYYFDPL